MFSNPNTGELTCEHVFYWCGADPILFVCTDSNGARFICSNYNLGENWIVAHVTEQVLVDMIDDKITICEAFEQCVNSVYHVSWDGEQYTFEPDAPSDMFPVEGALLELKDKGTKNYRKTLLQTR